LTSWFSLCHIQIEFKPQVGGKAARSSLLAVAPFSDTFSAGRRQKRPKLAAEGYEALVEGAAAREAK
jgi:hypothetical protein